MIMPGKLLRTCLLTVALTALCTIGASAACLGAGTVTADAQTGGGRADGT